MRLFEFTLLREGGNIFKDANKVPVTIRINRENVDPTLKWLEKIVKLPLVANKLGSTGKKETSGDLDIAIDEKKITKDELVARLAKWVEKNKPGEDLKLWVRKSGISVHFKTPINGKDLNGYVQTDLMFGDPVWLDFRMTGSNDDSAYGGAHRAMLIASIAKVMGMKFTNNAGLADRESNETITSDPDEIARILLGNKGAKRADLADVEHIIALLQKLPNYEELVADARKAFAHDELTLP